MAARVTRRLPGFKFEVRSPQLDERLPRMDIAVFTGFSASGPLHTPVAIEGSDQFAEIFGEDAPLAWDAERSRQVFAHLGPAVRSFFRNGGRRCWVIRVASDQAAYNYFAIPGLAMAEIGDDGRVNRIAPAFARARSEGSWSDSLRVSSALVSTPYEVTSLTRAIVELDDTSAEGLLLAVEAVGGDIAKGDLLRLTFEDETVAMVVVETVEEAADSPPSSRTHIVVGSTREVWLRPLPASDGPSLVPGIARIYRRIDAGVQSHDVAASAESEEIEARISWPSLSRDELEVFLRTSADNAPPAGSLIRLRAGAENVLMSVDDSGAADISDFGRAVRLTGSGSRVMRERQVLPPGLPVAEQLIFEMWVRRESDEATQLTELSFNSPGDRYWGGLPADKEFYGQSDFFQESGASEPGRVALAFEKRKSDLGQEARTARFPLSGAGSQTPVYFPVGMGALPLQYLGRLETEGLPLERDGLSEFDAALFLDPELIEAGTTSFSEQADFLRYLSPRPRRLRGVHAAFGIEEATIISAPDAVHRGWRRTAEPPEPVAEPSEPIPRPEWLHYRDCKDQQNGSPPENPELGYFLRCDVGAPAPPILSLSDAPDGTGTFTLEWSLESPPSAPPRSRFILEQATRADFSDAVVIYEGRDQTLVVVGRAPGEYYYRVRIEHGGNTSNWSNGVGVRVSPSRSYELAPVRAYSADAMLAVQRALLRMGGARGDLFVVLSMPEHYREDDALSHVKTLKSATSPAIEVNSRFLIDVEGDVEPRQVQALSLPLSAGEAADFSHAAVYHPWLIGGQERDRFSATPPDGEACGVIATRALKRGAWIAPANEAMSGLVAMTPAINSNRWLDLQESRINLIRQDPRGFMTLSADTLSDDDDLRPINVRRLLSLLRRLALRLGARYVFEPNDGSFRRMVQRGFEAMLGEMFVRGAFAGATPQSSFQVVTGDSLNTPQSVELGRFIVELRVAPSLPMTFMTIRLVQTGDRSLVLEAR